MTGTAEKGSQATARRFSPQGAHALKPSPDAAFPHLLAQTLGMAFGGALVADFGFAQGLEGAHNGEMCARRDRAWQPGNFCPSWTLVCSGQLSHGQNQPVAGRAAEGFNWDSAPPFATGAPRCRAVRSAAAIDRAGRGDCFPT